jgi:uncharacterized iron-regulated membrane protein
MATRLYGLIWKWHFVAGLVACPIVAIVALTGAIYTFEPEIQRWASADLIEVVPEGRPRPVDDLVAAAASRCEAGGITIAGPPDRSYIVWCRDSQRSVYLDPYRGTVLGERDAAKTTWSVATFFHVVFTLHWELMLGERGRLVIEWATSWTILLLVSGVVLWWPRGKRRGGGVLWPRGRLSGRQWLRDLHAVLGAYALPIVLTLAATGLMWTIHAGTGRWNRIAAEPELAPPVSREIPGAPRIGFDAALAGAGIDPATESRSIYAEAPGPKDKPDATYFLWVSDESHETPSTLELLRIDAYSGAVLRRTGWDDRSALGKVDAARYAIHVGAILGLPGRIAACVASLILAALCLTGPWMWWMRRPAGKLGIPPAARAPWSMVVLLAALGWVLPTVGVTLLVVAAVELLRWALRSWARRRVQTT